MARLGRSFLVAEGVGAVVALLLVARIPWPAGSIVQVGQFLAVVFFVSLFDVWLPHGDSIDIAEPLVLGAVVVLGPVPAAGIALVARVVAHLLRYRLSDADQLLHLVARRILSIAAAGLAFAALTAETQSLWFGQAVVLVGAAVAGVLADSLLLQAYTAARQRQSMGRLMLGSVKLQGLMWAAYVSVVVLTVILYPRMTIWGLLLMMGLLIVMRQSFSLLLDIRQAYQSTMEALAAALEAHDPRRHGHAERVAALARAIGIELGMHGSELERLGYAALLHDVDLIGTDTDDDTRSTKASSRAAEVLADVGFLKDVVPVLALCDGAHQVDPEQARLGMAAYIVCRASNMDELLGEGRGCVRTYPTEFLDRLAMKQDRERVEQAVWHLLTPGARTA